jgi:hypothetical protein
MVSALFRQHLLNVDLLMSGVWCLESGGEGVFLVHIAFGAKAPDGLLVLND